MRWQGLQFPIPLSTTWTSQQRQSLSVHGIPIRAAGTLVVPPRPTADASVAAIGEDPGTPTLTLLAYSGTITTWLMLERTDAASQAGNTIMDVSAHRIAEREARLYHRTVSGFLMNDYYVLKLSDDTLLWIWTDASYQPLIEHLRIDGP